MRRQFYFQGWRTSDNARLCKGHLSRQAWLETAVGGCLILSFSLRPPKKTEKRLRIKSQPLFELVWLRTNVFLLNQNKWHLIKTFGIHHELCPTLFLNPATLLRLFCLYSFFSKTKAITPHQRLLTQFLRTRVKTPSPRPDPSNG